jgi:hypothetical protein
MGKLRKGKFGRLVASRPLTDEGGGSAVGFLLHTIRLTEHVMKKQASKQKRAWPIICQNKKLVPFIFLICFLSWWGLSNMICSFAH